MGWKTLVNKKTDNKAKQETQVKAPDLEMKIDRITKDGKIQMSFNQDILLPPFLDEASSQELRGRSALTLAEVDVARDVIDF